MCTMSGSTVITDLKSVKRKLKIKFYVNRQSALAVGWRVIAPESPVTWWVELFSPTVYFTTVLLVSAPLAHPFIMTASALAWFPAGVNHLEVFQDNVTLFCYQAPWWPSRMWSHVAVSAGQGVKFRLHQLSDKAYHDCSLCVEFRAINNCSYYMKSKKWFSRKITLSFSLSASIGWIVFKLGTNLSFTQWIEFS